jgi:acyl dehydratase
MSVGPSPREASIYAEDLTEGSVIDLGAYTITRDEIVSFAQQWDPQPFHIDDDAAREGFFGEIIASGIHTMAIFQRLAVLGAYRDWAMIAGRSIREVQLTAPVKVGMTLSGSILIESVSYNHPSRALVAKRGTLTAGDTTIMTMYLDGYVRRRFPASE